MSSSSGEDVRTRLNNFCQLLKLELKYDNIQTGKQNEPTWKSVVHIKGIEYGTGTGLTKAAAKMAAAEVALKEMHNQYPGYSF